jgi:hypothetical protein
MLELVIQILLVREQFSALIDFTRAVIFRDTVAGKHLHIDNRAAHAGRHAQ